MAITFVDGFDLCGAVDLDSKSKLVGARWPKPLKLPAPENMRADGLYVVECRGGTMQMVVKLESAEEEKRFELVHRPGMLQVG